MVVGEAKIMGRIEVQQEIKGPEKVNAIKGSRRGRKRKKQTLVSHLRPKYTVA